MGLGAIPKPKEPPKKRRIKKQGEEERKVSVIDCNNGLTVALVLFTWCLLLLWQQVQGPYIGKDGRVKHIKNIGEAIPEQPLIGKGNLIMSYCLKCLY